MIKNLAKATGILGGQVLVGTIMYLGSVELIDLGFEAVRKGLGKMQERELRKQAEKEAEREQLKAELRAEILAEMQAKAEETVEA